MEYKRGINLTVPISIALIVLFIIWFMRRAPSQKSQNQPDFSTEFFERVRAGEKKILFLEVADQQDCMLIQSMLQSAEIPSYTEFMHLNRLYGGLAPVAQPWLFIRLFILEADYEAAADIVHEYLNKKNEAVKIENASPAVSLEKVISLVFAPYPVEKSEKILGVVIYPKK